MTSTKIDVKLDSLFNTISDAIVIPRSTVGTISDRIKTDFLNAFEMKLPEKLEYKPLGSLDITQHVNQKRFNNLKPVFHILMATCVDNNTSTYEAIEKVADEISKFTIRNPAVRDVAVPLLGTGAGKLDHMRVFQILTNNFIKNSRQDAVMEICVTDEWIYNSLIHPQIPQDHRASLSDDDLTSDQLLMMDKVLQEISIAHDCYAAGSLWDGNDQADEFFKLGVWKNGNVDRFVDLVSSIKPRSLILLKSTYAVQDISYLRIKGVGIVTSNPGNGKEVFVDWRVTHTKFDIPNKGSYRSTITKLSSQVFQEIIRDIPLWEKLILRIFPSHSYTREPEFTTPISHLAGLLSDSDDADDHLDIQADVDAFAKILSAKTFQPPLAIALFGKWGTGKSFFMRKLKERISFYSGQENKLVCTGIAHIHFNAWSYLDANLWASIISKIFEGLNQYISDNKRSDVEIAEVKAELMDRLSLNFLQMDQVKKEQSDLAEEIANLTTEKDRLVSDLEAKKKSLVEGFFTKTLSVVEDKLKVRERIELAFRENQSVISASQELSKIIPEDYLKDPATVLKKAESIETYIKVFFSRRNVLCNILWFLAIVLFVYYAPQGLHWIIKALVNTDFSIPPIDLTIKLLGAAVPILHVIRKTYEEVQPLVTSLWKIKVDYDAAFKDAQASLKIQEAEIAFSIAVAERKLTEVDEELKESERQRILLTYKTEHALSTEALYSFIGKRTISEDYQQHLGIVSLIRRDFEALSDLFYGHNLETKHVEFAQNFAKPLQRIVLYIDDLDRCREDRVVEVLEAVNLLMAFPLFVVVVGVDPRWVRNALIARYGSQFSADRGREMIEASDYLEKIFQVPFHLKVANDSNIRNMIRTLSSPYEFADSDKVRSTSNDNSTFEPARAEQIQDGEDIIILEQPAPLATEPVSEMRHVKLYSWEIALMEDMSVILGNNPRTIKRFVNVYQIVRAHAGLNYLIDDEEKEFMTILFLVALYNGCFRKLVPCFIKFMYKSDSARLSEFLKDDEKSPHVALKKQLDQILTTKPAYESLQRLAMANFKVHNAFIQRFSFYEIEPEGNLNNE